MPLTLRQPRRLLAAAGLGGLRSGRLHRMPGLFDPEWYVANYPEAAASKLPPMLHYLTEGARLGYDPHPLFDTDWYLQTYPQVAALGLNPLVHFLATPNVEKLDPNPCFSSQLYLERYPDVAAHGINPLLHYVRSGQREGRHGSWIHEALDDVGEPITTPVAEPRVTIIVPIFGQWPYTERCLRALAATEAVTLAKVVVVDDHGPDDSLRQLGRYPSVHVVPLPENLGYTRAVNKAAQDVTTPFILLLNNDTEPQPGFLSSMLEQMDSDPRVGAVGSRLTYANGFMQEAGSIVWNDASGHNYGHGQRASAHDVCYPRDVDYCSAASLLVRTDVWRDCGGFDERYAPAYYEDADLAFEIRRRGLRVRYEPRSVVIHHEGRSHGTDVTRGLKSHQQVNRLKFRAKWSQELADHALPGELPLAVAAHRPRQRVMVIVREALITPSRDAGSFRMAQIIKLWQAAGFRVVHVTPNANLSSSEARELRRAGQEVITTQTDALEFLGENRDWVAAVWYTHVGAVWNWLPTLSNAAPEVPTVFDTVDLHHLREKAQAALVGSELDAARAARTAFRELWAVSVTDATVVVNATEADYLRQRRPGAKVHLVSTIHPDQDLAGGFADRRGLLFIGSFHHPPNLDALDWFLREVWPRLSPSVRADGLDVVGSPAPVHLATADQAGVRMHGWVPETQPFLASARVSLAPVRYGAGVKGKVGEAWSHGLPVAATSVALDGMVIQGDYPAGDTPEAFAALVERFYSDPESWTRARALGLGHVARAFSPATASAALAVLQESLDRARPVVQAEAGRADDRVSPWDLPGWPS